MVHGTMQLGVIADLSQLELVTYEISHVSYGVTTACVYLFDGTGIYKTHSHCLAVL